MGSSLNDNSFIPKRGPASRPKRTATQQVYIFTLISYVLFSASLIGAVGVFLFDRYVDQQLQNEVAALSEAINQFREADLDRVRTFNARIEYTKERLNAAVSLPAIFTLLENTTAQTAQIQSLSIERVGDAGLVVDASMVTDTFDSSLFQREFYEQENLIGDVRLSDIAIQVDSNDANQITGTDITFTANLAVPAASIPLTFEPVTFAQPATIPELSEEVTPTSTPTAIPTSTEESLPAVNQDDI